MNDGVNGQAVTDPAGVSAPPLVPTNNPEKLEPAPNREYVLTPEERSVFAGLVQTLNQQATGAVQMVVATRKLEGSWTLSPDNSKLIRQG